MPPSVPAPPVVLIVEDDENILLSLEFALTQEGFTVRTARTGAQAITSLGTMRPGALVLDLMLPDISGYEVCRFVRTDPRLSGLPVLMLTARAQEAEREYGMAQGASDYITKPFNVASLIQRLRVHTSVAGTHR
ncbi:MAG: response regulator [Chloroflexota bacterium]